MSISASELMYTYLLTVNDDQVKLCLYQEINKDNENYGEIWLEVENDDEVQINIEEITSSARLKLSKER